MRYLVSDIQTYIVPFVASEIGTQSSKERIMPAAIVPLVLSSQQLMFEMEGKLSSILMTTELLAEMRSQILEFKSLVGISSPYTKTSLHQQEMPAMHIRVLRPKSRRLE
jgi:hypothetical protein